MQFWRLVSLFRGNGDALRRSLVDSGKQQLVDWYDQFDRLVGKQDRTILDSRIPDEICRRALAQCPLHFILLEGRLMIERTKAQLPEGAERLSALECFEKFDGDILEDVQEFGTVELKFWKGAGN